MVGFDYLQETLTPLIEAVYADKESCEIDPTRLEKGEDIKKNQKRLIAFTKKFFDCISNSIDHCPKYISNLLFILYEFFYLSKNLNQKNKIVK